MNDQSLAMLCVGSKRAIVNRKLRQVFFSIQHYGQELSRCRSPRDVADWIYYKFPTMFPLRDYPVAINIELTNDCNFGCPHCPRTALNRGRTLGHMDVDVFKKIVEESRSRASEVKLIGMGEPALHPQIEAIMTILKGSGFKTQLFTNGTLLEKHDPQTILSWEANEIVVSIDGTDARSYERLRPGGRYQALCENVKAFRAERDRWPGRRPQIQVRHVIMPNETPDALSAFARFWRSQFADSIKYCFLGEPYDHPRSAPAWRPSCRDIRREMHIRFDGGVPLCGYNGHREWIGNVATASVEQVWRNARLEEVRRLHQAGDLSDLDFCKTCQFW
jgi:MoaA/NifB/PqqE/SkfB family radical SAM enzyme